MRQQVPTAVAKDTIDLYSTKEFPCVVNEPTMKTLIKPRLAIPALASAGLDGCTAARAPSYEFFGAFFPAWMLCALAGILGAAAARAVFSRPRLAGAVPYQLAVCTAVGVIVALLIWLIFFR